MCVRECVRRGERAFVTLQPRLRRCLLPRSYSNIFYVITFHLCVIAVDPLPMNHFVCGYITATANVSIPGKKHCADEINV